MNDVFLGGIQGRKWMVREDLGRIVQIVLEKCLLKELRHWFS